MGLAGATASTVKATPLVVLVLLALDLSMDLMVHWWVWLAKVTPSGSCKDQPPETNTTPATLGATGVAALV